MTFVIIEDEKPNAIRLKRIVEEIDASYQVVATIHTVTEAVDWFNNNPHPALALMDIRLADGLSFDIFSRVKISSSVIFTTAYDEYAIQAFKVNSVDYLLKPVEKEELVNAIEKARNLHVTASSDPYLSELLSYIKRKDVKYRTRFLFPYKDGFKTVNVSDIAFVYSEAKNTHLVLQNGSMQLAGQTMEELEEQLDPDQFFRANRQYIVNINSLDSIHNHFNGKLKIVVKNHEDHEIVVSKEKAPAFKQWLDR